MFSLQSLQTDILNSAVILNTYFCTFSVTKQYRAPEIGTAWYPIRTDFDTHVTVLHTDLDPKSDVPFLFVGLFGDVESWSHDRLNRNV
jgi:hypothetical protein